MTSKGFRPAPFVEEIIAFQDEKKDSSAVDDSIDTLYYPVLIISLDCAFCPPAKNLWSRIADEVEVDLRVITIEKDKEVLRRYGLSGVPCLVCGPETKVYGLHYSHEEAKKLLASVLER